MRQLLLSSGASELSYEIREIVKKAEQIKKLGKEIFFSCKTREELEKWSEAIGKIGRSPQRSKSVFEMF